MLALNHGPSRIQIEASGRRARQAANVFRLASGRFESRARSNCLSDVLKDLKQSDQLIPRLQKLHEAMPDSIAVAFDLAEQYRKADKLAEAQAAVRSHVEEKADGRSLPGARGHRSPHRPEGIAVAIARRRGREDRFARRARRRRQNRSSADDKLVAALLDLAQTRAFRRQAGRLMVRCWPPPRWPPTASNTIEAGKFYDLAIKAGPKHKAELLLAWGLTLVAADKNEEAVKVLQRGVDEGGLAGRSAAGVRILSGRGAGNDRQDRRGAGRRPKDGRRKERARMCDSFPARPGFCSTPSVTTKSYKAYKDLIEKHDADFSSEETREAAPRRPQRAVEHLRHPTSLARSGGMARASAR